MDLAETFKSFNPDNTRALKAKQASKPTQAMILRFQGPKSFLQGHEVFTMAMGTRKTAPKASEGPVAASSDPVEASTPRPVHGLETHSLSAREQLMRQWPSWDWETRDSD